LGDEAMGDFGVVRIGIHRANTCTTLLYYKRHVGCI